MRTALAVLLLAPAALEARGLPKPVEPTAPIVLSRADEIRLARSAAPASVSAEARVWVLSNGRYEVVEPGTSGAACFVARSQRLSLEPECGDTEAEATWFTVERWQVEQRLAGRTPAEVDRTTRDSLAAGRSRVPRRPATVYMMSSAQVLYDENGKFAGRWMPHTMLYFPNLNATDLGVAAGHSDHAAPSVDRPGTPWSNIVTVVRSWVDPAPAP